jgi:hypothetical protein
MPCIFCRESFKKFSKELPIDKFMSGRIELMRWLYEIRNKVNKKLIDQEKKCYNDEKRRLKKLYHNNSLSSSDYYDQLQKFKEKTLITNISPPFEEILDKYESIRAVCSKKSKTCSLPNKK